jgi:hypothetical protein
MKASKSTISEGIFSTMLGAYRDYKDATGGEKEMRLDKRILQEVAYKGFQDLSQRLKSAGIDLDNAAAIREPRTQDIIRDNTVKYVEQYMSGGEYPDRQKEIINALQEAVEKNKIETPTEWNKKTIFNYFLQAATIRANVLINLDSKLDYNKDNYEDKKLEELVFKAVQGIASKLGKAEDKKEIILPNVNILGTDTKIVFRIGNDNSVRVYSEKDIPLPAGISDPVASTSETVQPYGSMVNIKDSRILAQIFKEYITAGRSIDATQYDERTDVEKNLQGMKELQNSLEDNQEIEFTATVGTTDTTIVVRKDGVYSTKFFGKNPPSGSNPKTVNISGRDDPMYQVQRDQNLANLYAIYSSLSPKPTPTDFEAETLE